MFASIIHQILLAILQRIAEEVQSAIASGTTSAPLPQSLISLFEAYWEIRILEELGLFKTPDPEGPIDGPSPFSLQPQPGPSPMSGSLFRDSLLLDTLHLAMGDPHPQPDSWIQALGNKQIRINSAKKLRDHLKKAIPQLEAEAKRLEGLQ